VFLGPATEIRKYPVDACAHSDRIAVIFKGRKDEGTDDGIKHHPTSRNAKPVWLRCTLF